jgi:PEP-CTERM motif
LLIHPWRGLAVQPAILGGTQMVVRVRDMTALTVVAAALPFAAHAATDFSPTPSIGCSTDGGFASTINWGDGLSLGSPNVLVQNSASRVPAVQNFACSGSMYSTAVQGDSFAVNFGAPGTLPADRKDKWIVETSEYKEFKFDVEYNVTEFDIYGDVYQILGDGSSILDHKDFIGIKYDSTLGNALSDTNSLFVDTNGDLVLDPPIGGGSGVVELITTPTSPVPEPTSIILFGTGLVAAAQVLRRKSRR